MLVNVLKAARSLARAENYARGAALQERVDLLRLAMLRTAHANWPSMEEQTLETVHAEAPSLAAQRTLVQDAVRAQTIRLLHGWHVERPPPPPPQDPNALPSAKELAALAIVWGEETRAAQERAFGFALKVGASTAGDGSGDGVFVRGSRPPGSVVAFFPGVLYMPLDLYLLRGGTSRFRGIDHLMARHDSCVFDGSATALKRLAPEARACPLSVGHKINHPPVGAEPNVMPCAIDYDGSSYSGSHESIAREWADGMLVPVVVLVVVVGGRVGREGARCLSHR